MWCTTCCAAVPMLTGLCGKEGCHQSTARSAARNTLLCGSSRQMLLSKPAFCSGCFLLWPTDEFTPLFVACLFVWYGAFVLCVELTAEVCSVWEWGDVQWVSRTSRPGRRPSKLGADREAQQTQQVPLGSRSSMLCCAACLWLLHVHTNHTNAWLARTHWHRQPATPFPQKGTVSVGKKCFEAKKLL